MAEYIEREATCKDCVHYGVCIWTQVETKSKKICKDFKNKADVVEVRHGEWIADDKFDNGKSSIFHCSECYYSRSTSVLYTAEKLAVDDPYCKNCGAKMHGKDGAE